jgi:hypothetical protein
MAGLDRWWLRFDLPGPTFIHLSERFIVSPLNPIRMGFGGETERGHFMTTRFSLAVAIVPFWQ